MVLTLAMQVTRNSNLIVISRVLVTHRLIGI